MDAIRYYVQGAFQSMEETSAVLEQQEELVADLDAKVADLVAAGRTEQQAIDETIASMGDLAPLLAEFERRQAGGTASTAPAAKRHPWRVAMIVAIALAAVLSLAALAVAGLGGALMYRAQVSPDAGPANRESMQTEYRLAAARLTLPPGIYFPAEAPGGEEAATAHFNTGHGLNFAQNYWQVAWEREWLAQRSRTGDRARRALVVLADQVPRTESMTIYSDETVRRRWTEIIKKARAGDPSGIQEDVKMNPADLKTTP